MKKIRLYFIILILAQIIPILAINTLTTNSYIDSDDNSMLVDSITITNFSDFIYKENSAHVKSTNNGSVITYHYNGSSSSLERDVFIYEFDENITDFVIEFDVDYNYTSPIVFASFAPYFNSMYKEDGSLSNNTIGYIELQDSWTNNYGLFHIISSPYNIVDDYLTASGSMGQNGSITMIASRQSNDTHLAIINKTSETTILSHTWTGGNWRSLNYIDLWFRGGYTAGNATVTLSNLIMFCNSTTTTLPPITETPTTPTTTPTTFSFTIGISFIGISLLTFGTLTILMVYNSKRKK